MTIEQSEPAEAALQDAVNQSDHSGRLGDEVIESLVRSPVAERAEEADRRSAELAERVALLEGELRGGRRDSSNIEETNGPTAKPSIIMNRLGSTKKVACALGSTQDLADSSRRSMSMRVVDGAPEMGLPTDVDPEEAMNNRITLLERRLENCEEEKEVVFDERKYPLPESTFSFLVTHRPLSVPFAFAVFSMALSVSCLSLTLASSIEKGVKGNPLGIPAGVDGMVQGAQFLGAIVGVLMEDEIPQGLQLIANAAGHTLLLNGGKAVQKRVIISSVFRLAVGYLFLSSLFINIVQNDDVLEIFYDVLALEFVENIDDTSFALAKRGFFGKSMLIAANEKYNLQMSSTRRPVMVRGGRVGTRSVQEHRLSFSGLIASNNCVNRLVRFVYFLNAAIILGGLSFITIKQRDGEYRCRSIDVLFDEEIWERSHVRLPDGSREDRLLIYSYFNGVYREDGSHDGYPKYVEQNKNNGNPFGSSVVGAEIIYCNDISSWVFRHPNITTSPYGYEKEENECSWLLKSTPIDNHDILSSTGAWEAWIGEVKPLVQVEITCNECSQRSDCNYHGSCGSDNRCTCSSGYSGENCQFEMPCPSLASEKAHTFDPLKGMQWKQENPIRQVHGHQVYNRPVYIQKGLKGEPYDMRLYKLLEKDISFSPSDQLTYAPSISTLPTYSPTLNPTKQPTYPPTVADGGGDGVAAGVPAPTSLPQVQVPASPNNVPPSLFSPNNIISAPEHPSTPPTLIPTTWDPDKPWHSPNEYDVAPDFADHDDFFESKALHNLEGILNDYSVVISYAGSRFYGTIIEPNRSLDELFPSDYHAFWSESFDVDRTFIISDITFASTPVGVDWFEMRRRIINSIQDQNVKFSYGPYGALIPLMDYEGTGFFHCLGETEPRPTFSGAPTPTPSTSISPSTSAHRLFSY